MSYWFLTCMVIAMFASLITGIAFVNHKTDEKKLKIFPLFAAAFVTGIAYAAAGVSSILVLNQNKGVPRNYIS